MAFALMGAKIFTGEDFLDEHAIIIEESRIFSVEPENRIAVDMERRDLGGGLLAPGFIDVQVNGGGGALLNDSPTLDAVRVIAAAHRRLGTVGLLPTVITDAPSVIIEAAGAVRQAQREGVPGVLGLHIEGPFIDPKRKGAHAARFIREMTEADVERLASLDCGTLMLTLAPNKVYPEMIRQLADHSVLVSLGHAEASYDEAMAGLAAGAQAFTHLYNAMSQINGREPGMVGAALSDTRSFVGIIADGHHVHDAAMKVAFAAKPKSRMMLVSDAMLTAAGGPDRFELQGRKVVRSEGRLQLEDGTLAGSDLTLDQAVRYCVNRLGLELGDTLRMASLNPAAFLRRGHELGRIAPGYLASLVHLRDDLTVKATWVDGA